MRKLILVLLFVAGQAQAASDLVFQNELQVVAMNEKNELQVAAPADQKIDAKVGAELDEAAMLIGSMEEPSATMAAAGDNSAKAATPAKQESDIPVKLDAKADEKNADNSLRDMLLAFALLFGFVGLAYLGLRRLKSRNPKTSQFQMKILSQHHLGPKKSLAVVRVAGESMLIGVTDHHISMIKSLALLDEDIPEEVPRTEFGNFFRAKTQVPELETESEDFAISKIRDVVTRQVRQLKSLE